MEESSSNRWKTLWEKEKLLVEQFVLFPVFSRDLYCRHVKPGLVWERVNTIRFFFLSVTMLIYIFPIFNRIELEFTLLNYTCQGQGDHSVRSRSYKEVFNVLAKGIASCQPAQFAQADMGRNFLPFVKLIHPNGPFYTHPYRVDCQSKWIFVDP